MMIQIIENALENGCRSIELATEKKAIRIWEGGSFTTVCVQNAMHRAWRGCGRVFHGENRLQQALESYKDSQVKAMIELALELTGEAQNA